MWIKIRGKLICTICRDEYKKVTKEKSKINHPIKVLKMEKLSSYKSYKNCSKTIKIDQREIF